MLFKKRKRSNGNINFLPIGTFFIIGALYFLSVSYSEKWNFNWTGIRTEIRDSIKALDHDGRLTSEFVGYNMATPNQWHRQNWLRRHINTNELIQLTDYPSGTVKGFVYEELMRNSKIEKYNLCKKVLNDTLTFVHYSSGCIGTGFMLSEFTIRYAPDFGGYEIREALTKAEFREIDSLLELRLQKKDFYRREYQKGIK